MRRVLTLLATIAILIGLVAAPAAADKPVESTQILHFDETNSPLPLNDPCTGESMDYFDIVLVTRLHEGHPNNIVGITKGYGTTGSGYVLSGSPDHFTLRGDPFVPDFVAAGFSDMWTNPVNGDKMHMHSVFVMKDGILQVDIISSRCVGAPTIEPLP